MHGFEGASFSPLCCGGLVEFELPDVPCGADSGISPPLISGDAVNSALDRAKPAIVPFALRLRIAAVWSVVLPGASSGALGWSTIIL